jgi:hypothetical protein
MDKTMIYGGAYIAGLRRFAAERRAQRDAAAQAAIADPRAELRARLTTWYDALPPDARPLGGFLIEDIRKAVYAPVQSLGLALWELQWSRKRVWSNTGPFRRYWFPPEQ